MNFKKGVSLIVLVITIIVIIILAAAVILTLTGNNPIANAKEASFVNDMGTFRDELEMYKASQYAIKLGDFDVNSLDTFSDAEIYPMIPSLQGKIKYADKLQIINGQLYYVAVDEKTDWATSINMSASKELPVAANGIIDPGYISLKGVNGPVLKTGMTAKKWNSTTSTWDTITDPVADTSWYDYSTKQWANAQTADGSMWVWIPRYEYKIPTPHSSTAQTIAVNFINGTSTTVTSGYTMHPAFTFGTDELTGIWVAKFEASGTTSEVDVKPNVISLRSTTISNIFISCRNMEINTRYGWGTTGIGIDTHLMKNIEWGTAAYLSHSIYGKNAEVTINANSSYLTGDGSYVTNTSQSTTGNIYGIYDMSGGAYEYTAAYVNNGNVNLTTYGLSLVSAADKYKDIYVSSGDTRTGNYSVNSEKKGDAVYETSMSGELSSSWYTDYSYMPSSSNPFFILGGYYNDGAKSGIFSFNSDAGFGMFFGFRPCLAISSAI